MEESFGALTEKEFLDMTISRQKKKRKKLLRSSLNILEVDVRSGWRGEQDLACDDSRQVHNADYYARITPVGHCRNVQRPMLKFTSVQL